jgi:hypothetical protein
METYVQRGTIPGIKYLRGLCNEFRVSCVVCAVGTVRRGMRFENWGDPFGEHRGHSVPVMTKLSIAKFWILKCLCVSNFDINRRGSEH